MPKNTKIMMKIVFWVETAKNWRKKYAASHFSVSNLSEIKTFLWVCLLYLVVNLPNGQLLVQVATKEGLVHLLKLLQPVLKVLHACWIRQRCIELDLIILGVHKELVIRTPEARKSHHRDCRDICEDANCNISRRKLYRKEQQQSRECTSSVSVIVVVGR